MGIYRSGAALDIRGISEEMQPALELWFDGRIQIIDPDISGGSYDRTTNTVTGRSPQVVWEGPARVQGMRWPNMTNPRGEAVALRAVVFHFPRTSDVSIGFIREGWRVKVVDGGMSPEFEKGLYVITASVNTSYAWDRRLETVMDQGAEI